MKFSALFGWFCAMALAVAAQDTKNADQPFQSMLQANAFRGQIASDVAAGKQTPVEAIKQLRSIRSPSGLNLAADADLGLAAIDIGQRLLLRYPAEAEEFFRAAEAALDEEVKRTDDAKAKDKAQYLQKLAMIRGNYLNKPAQARADMAAAIKLQPEDEYLAQFQKVLAARTGQPDQTLGRKETAK